MIFYLAALCCTSPTASGVSEGGAVSSCPSIAIRTRKTALTVCTKLASYFASPGTNKEQFGWTSFFTHFAEFIRHKKRRVQSNNGIHSRYAQTIRKTNLNSHIPTLASHEYTRSQCYMNFFHFCCGLKSHILSPLLFFLVILARERAGHFVFNG